MCVVFLAACQLSAAGYNLSWIKQFSAGKQYNCYDVLKTSDSGLIAVGSSANELKSGKNDFSILRLNRNWDTVWTRIYGENGDDRAYSVCECKRGGYLVTGTTEYMSNGSKDIADIWILRLSANGDSLWSKRFGNAADYDYAKSVVSLEDSTYLIVGRSENNGFIMKVNNIGDSLWTRKIGFIPQSIFAQSNNTFGISGCDTNGTCITTVDSSGNTLQPKFYLNSSTYASTIIPYVNNSFVVCGMLNPGVWAYSAFITRIDSSGKEMWYKTYNSTYVASVMALSAIGNDSGFIMSSSFGNDALGRDMSAWIIRTDNKGDSLWTAEVDSYRSSVRSLIVYGNKIYGAGDTRSKTTFLMDVLLFEIVEKSSSAKIAYRSGAFPFVNQRSTSSVFFDLTGRWVKKDLNTMRKLPVKRFIQNK
jgi:hypothetical protein